MTSAATKIDEVDTQILHLLLIDARLSLRKIAKECKISSVSVYNRIERLKKLGVLKGSTLFASLDIYNFSIIAFLGIETEDNTYIDEILNCLKEYTFPIEPSVSIGTFDIHALVYAKDQIDLNNRVNMIRRLQGVRKVAVFIWSGMPLANYRNVDLNPQKR
jgi:Lrp/AsnC family transcriptional regulator for asnA, asnC and gidA